VRRRRIRALAALDPFRDDSGVGERVTPGACLCGGVRFEVVGPLDRVVHCHCTMCQRAHGAAFVTWAAVGEERVRILAGQSDVARYRSSEIGTRSFCRTCGSSLFCTLDTHPGVIDVALACLAPEHGAVPRAHVFWDDRAGWIELADRLPRLGGKSGLEPR
jgi:hypothetical protein